MAQSDSQMTPRHWIAATALIGALVALYLHLWKLGLMGALSCNAIQSCEVVMLSPYGMFFGVDVALIGTIGYTLILITALIGIRPDQARNRTITTVLMVLIATGFLFTVRLKYYEWFFLQRFCKWCFISTVIITTQLIAVILDRRPGRAKS